LTIPLLTLAEDSIDDFPVISHWTCDETSGIRYDSNESVNNDLTDNNTVASATGLLSNACDFERDNTEYLSILDVNQTSLDDTTFCLSYWIKPESLPPSQDTSYEIINKLANDGGRVGYGLTYQQYPTNSYTLYSVFGNADNNWDGNVFTLSTASWTHLVNCFNTDDTTTYKDGVLLTGQSESGTGSVGNFSAPFTIGNKTYMNLSSNEYSFDGLIDEVSFFSSVLTDAQVTTLYNSGTPLPYTYSAPATSSTSTTATSTQSFEDDNILFALGVIIFFLTFLCFGFIASDFNKI